MFNSKSFAQFAVSGNKTKRCVTHDASEQTIEIAHEHVHMLIVIQNVIKTQMLNLMLHYVLCFLSREEIIKTARNILFMKFKAG